MDEPLPPPNKKRLSAGKVAALASLLPLTMLGASFAAVPLYDLFCRVTGFGGTTQVAQSGPNAVLDRQVNVRFDANLGAGTPLEFRPLQQAEGLRVGQTGLAFYEVTNTSDQPFKAIASYNVTPHKAGPFFQKLECFCFIEQVFPPGETMRLPVVFFVDPRMDEEDNQDDVRTITLSYTFFDASKTQLRDIPEGVNPKAIGIDRQANALKTDATIRSEG